MMRRFLQLALCMTVLFALVALTGKAASANPSWKMDPGIPDTLSIPSIDWRGDTIIALDISAVTDDSLGVAQIVLTWSNPALRFVSAQINIGRWNVPGYHKWTSADVDTGVVVAFMPTQKRLPPGSGPVVRLYFGRDSAFVFESDITMSVGTIAALPPLAPYEMLFADLANDPYVPTELVSSLIAYSPCFCESHGDVSDDGEFNAVDLNTLIDGLFFGAPSPPADPDCPHIHRGDYSCDNAYDAVDLNLIIDFLFFGGDVLCDPCEDLP